MSDKLTPQVAIRALIQGVVVAQKRGAYNLEEAETLSRAVKSLTAPAQTQTPAQTQAPAQIPAQAPTQQNISMNVEEV